MEIRPLVARTDVRQAIRAHALAWQSGYDHILPADRLERLTVDPDPDDVDEWIARFPDRDGVTLAASVDGGVRGYVLVRWAETKYFVRGGEAELKELYVHPEWWGKGVGTALLENGLSRVPADRTGVALSVLAENGRARRFYEKHGFELDHTGAVTIGSATYRTMLYRRPLDR
jgi:ribosomal protein S18 acetylase RimI-like enzyme